MKTIANKNLCISTTNKNIFESAEKRVSAGNKGATVFIPHVCNNIDLFDAGFAYQVAQRYPVVKTDYHLLGKNFLLNNLGYTQIIKVYQDPHYRHSLFFVNMIAQNGVRSFSNKRPLNYFALGQSMHKLSQYIHNNTGFASKNENIEIHCPKFGSGLAGGDWSFIKELIHDIWGKFFVTIYTPSNNKI